MPVVFKITIILPAKSLQFYQKYLLVLLNYRTPRLRQSHAIYLKSPVVLLSQCRFTAQSLQSSQKSPAVLLS
jgi:hypothetical protein